MSSTVPASTIFQTVVNTATGATTITTSNNTLAWVNTSGSTIPTPMWIGPTPTVGQTGTQYVDRLVPVPTMMIPDYIKLEVGKERNIEFPDGTIITFRADGSFGIYDKDAKVIYKANRTRDFNPFINASDKLEEFIQYCGTIGVRQGDMLGIPIKHFVQWLVIEAARADGETTSEVLALKDYSQPRCRVCTRFMSPKLKENRIEFCRPSCFTIGLERVKTPQEKSNVSRSIPSRRQIPRPDLTRS